MGTHPATIIRLGSTDTANVLAIQRRLNMRGCGPVAEGGHFDEATDAAVRLFQARFTDRDRLPLKVDGTVGPLTWEALFGIDPMPTNADAGAADDPFLRQVLDVAVAELGIMEVPAGSNRGPRVDEYVRSVGLDPAGQYPWCASFVFWCFKQAAAATVRSNPAIKTGGVLDHWRRAESQGIRCIGAEKTSAATNLVRSGQLFVISTGAGNGHIGFVERVAGGKLVTIEGNTNDGGSREGIGVFRREQRKIADINVGFIDYGA